MSPVYSNNPLTDFHLQVEQIPNEYGPEIKQQVALQKEMLVLFDFIEDKGKRVVDWIEKFCVLTEGEKAGTKVKLMLWQKWVIYSIFAFYGNIETEIYDDNGVFVKRDYKYSRIVNDVLILVGSGNAKTSFVGFINAYVLYSSEFKAPKIYIGSNAYKQSRLCFDTTYNIIFKNSILSKYADLRPSIGEIEVKKTSGKLTAMSSDGKNQEGIIPALLIIDEIHEMKNSAYADNLRKSTKRDDALIIETSTEGTVRNGYLDLRVDFGKKLLSNDSEEKDYRKLFVIFKQESEEEIIEAFRSNNMSVLRKSNPSLGVPGAVSVALLKDKIKDMINDPSKKATTLTKNFNIPQNPVTSYFSENECRTKPFDENIFMNAPVFIGLDMAYTRNPDNDLAGIEILMVNPFTEEEYCKDIYFLPKYWEKQTRENNELIIEKLDMIKEKSKVDSNIHYNAKRNQYGYQAYANRGDLVIINEELNDKLVSLYGDDAKIDCTGVTEKFIIYYCAYLEKTFNFTICKFGLDPNKASTIESFMNQNIRSLDGLPPAIKFRMEDKKISNPIIESTKDKRARGLVYNNNKLTELHFASAQAKVSDTGITFTNSMRERKDGVIINLAARSAYHVFTSNNKTGAGNLAVLKEWWINSGILEKEDISQ